MMRSIEDMFGEEPRLYPGSRHRIPEKREPPKAVAEDAWDARPVMLKVRGQTMEFFTIGMLAAALGRRPSTLREWETKGLIPKARFRTAATDPAKRKRLYTRAQVEGMVRIAQEEGLMAFSRAGGLRRAEISLVFTERVLALFRGLEGK